MRRGARGRGASPGRRGDGLIRMGVPIDVARARSHELARLWARALRHTTPSRTAPSTPPVSTARPTSPFRSGPCKGRSDRDAKAHRLPRRARENHQQTRSCDHLKAWVRRGIQLTSARREAILAARAVPGCDADHGFPLRHGVEVMELDGNSGAMGTRRHAEIADGGVYGDEPLQASWGSKALFRPLLSSQRQVRILGPIVEALVRAMLDRWHDPAPGSGICRPAKSEPKDALLIEGGRRAAVSDEDRGRPDTPAARILIALPKPLRADIRRANLSRSAADSARLSRRLDGESSAVGVGHRGELSCLGRAY